jgi:F-type H+-transporting ATPase subunit b
MPQLEFADFAPQLVWLAITFGLLWILMARVALPRVSDVLLSREQRITNDLDAAERLNNEAQEALKAYETALAEARAKANALAVEKRAKVQAKAEAAQAEAEARLAERAAEAEAQIQAARNEAMGNVREIASAAATGVVTQLLGDVPDDAALNAVLDAELANAGVN